MNELDFDHFCRMIRERSGLVLTPDKAYLVASRLEPLARSAKFADVAALLTQLRKGAPEALIQQCVDALATHESYFFRDGAPFEQFASTVLPALLQARQPTRTLRVWCAACSSGQEVYSVAMILQELGHRLSGWKVEVIGTDMSQPILSKARAGLYSDFEVKRGLSEARLNRWFKAEGPVWKVSPVLQEMVQFRTHNLLRGSAGLGTFDVIFCRNVLIYFDVENKRRILEGIGSALAPDGALILGSAETVLGVTRAFENMPGARGIYRPTPDLIARSA